MADKTLGEQTALTSVVDSTLFATSSDGSNLRKATAAQVFEAMRRDITDFDLKAEGLAVDGTTNDATAFRSAWNFLRDEWYTNGRIRTVICPGDVLISSPTSDRSGVAAFVMDFPVIWQQAPGSRLLVEGVTTGAAFQIGTYESLSLWRVLQNFGVDCNDECNGLIFSNTFQNRLVVESAWATQCIDAFTIHNCQEGLFRNLTAEDSVRGIRIPAAISIASGTNNTYTTDTSIGLATNNIIQTPSCKSNSETDILIEWGDNNRIQGGVAQSATSGWNLDIAGGTGLTVDGTYLETAVSHRELRVRSTYTDYVHLSSVHGTSSGAQANIEGGTVLWWGAGEWRGRIDGTGTGKITADRAPGNEITGNYFLLSSFDNIGGYSNIVYQRPGDRGMLYTSGTLAPSAEADFVQWGRNSISNYRCAFKAELTIYRDDEYVRMCDIWASHSPDVGYPVAHFVVVDKLANIADISVVVDAYRVSSSPNHEIRGRIKNNNDTENIFWEARVWLSAQLT